jgi:selenocysteine lyase/cysteine desulfurase
MLDISKLRQNTPGTLHKVHFNNAGAALMEQSVYDEVLNYQQYELINGGYEAQNHFEQELQNFYSECAKMLNCGPHNIAFTSGASHAWDLAFYGLNLNEGDEIITSHTEYVSNYLSLLKATKEQGVVIKVIDNDEHGSLNLAHLKELINDKTKLMTLAYIPTSGGQVNPVNEAGKLASEHGVTFILDACQAVGQIPIDLNTIHCDYLCATGRKYLRGPRGTGFLYVSDEALRKFGPHSVNARSAVWSGVNDLKVNEDATQYEDWEHNCAAKLGLAKAINNYITLDGKELWERIQNLAKSIRNKLRSIPKITVTDRGQLQCGIVTFHHESIDSAEIVKAMLAKNFNCTLTPKDFARLDLETRGLGDLVRASLHYYNTEEEIDNYCECLVQIISSHA